jgi:hypothetical protein
LTFSLSCSLSLFGALRRDASTIATARRRHTLRRSDAGHRAVPAPRARRRPASIEQQRAET